MPLNEIAKLKLIDWLTKAGQSIQDDMVDQFADRGRSIVALGEIFTQDEEWARELVASGYLLTFTSFILRRWEDIKEDIQDSIKTRISSFTEESINAVQINDWLKFHKSIRDLVYDLTQIV